MTSTADDIKNRISEICSHFTFELDGVRCGVDPLSSTKFEMWYGDEDCTVHSIDEVMSSPFFKGCTLTEISEKISITEW